MREHIILPSDSMRHPRARRWPLVLFGLILVFFFGARTAIHFYVETLWFGSLGYSAVFWKALDLEWATFAVFALLTFAVLYGWARVLLHVAGPDLRNASTFRIGPRVYALPLKGVLSIGGLVFSIIAALVAGASMQAQWQRFALFLHQPKVGTLTDPIFGHSLDFYLFTLPAWQSISGWLFVLAFLLCLSGVFLLLIAGGARMSLDGFDRSRPLPWRTFSIAVMLLLAVISMRVYLGRLEMLLEDHPLFSGVTYTQAHVLQGGNLVVCWALLIGALIAAANFVSRPRMRWVVLSPVPAAVCFLAVQLAAWYVSVFIVKPNQLVREQQYIRHNIEYTRTAFGLDRMQHQEFPAQTAVEAADPAHNQTTLQNIRLWDWQALRDTLRQIQEIRTYYDFPDVDIDRYTIDGQTKEVMLAARELNTERLPGNSRDWINQKLIYTHGYGITMNPVNGFTAEGLPALMLSDMPIQSTVPSIQVKRPEIYYGQIGDRDVYVKTRQKEFNFPQGETYSVTSYEGESGIRMGGLLRRVLIAFDRGDLSKVPFSDDIGPDSRLLMRRNIEERIHTLAPFLTYENDAYIVVGDDSRLTWVLDAFTTSNSFPYATHYRLEDDHINYVRNSVKVTVDAYTGATTFYVFDPQDPVIGAWRGIFPTLFKDASAMPQDLRRHMRYPELLLKLQAQVYGVYHMTDPVVFYNHEDLWTIASELVSEQGQQNSQSMNPNFVLMKLPGQEQTEFVDILPFTPANRNNLIGWIAGRSDGANYGTAVVYNFPKTRLVDGPMQIEARIDQNAQISGQLTLWNQQGSHVRRGTLLVIPCGKALIYAEALYLQAERSPMPELRLVVLALQDKLAYGTTFEAALQSLFAGVPSSLNGEPASSNPSQPQQAGPGGNAPEDVNALIHDAARDLSDYQRLTAEGKLAEAGQRLQQLKQKLEELNARSSK